MQNNNPCCTARNGKIIGWRGSDGRPNFRSDFADNSGCSCRPDGDPPPNMSGSMNIYDYSAPGEPDFRLGGGSRSGIQHLLENNNGWGRYESYHHFVALDDPNSKWIIWRNGVERGRLEGVLGTSLRFPPGLFPGYTNLWLTHYIDADNACDDDSINRPDLLCGADYQLKFDELYIDKTQARVELCNFSNWSSRPGGLCELQLPQNEWVNDRIQIKVRLGELSAAGPLYLFVIDDAGAVSPGFAASVQGDSVPPAAPQLLRRD